MTSDFTESGTKQDTEVSAVLLFDVITQHAEDAVFLATQRQAAVRASGIKLAQLLRLDERLEANLDGLQVAGELGWKYLLRESSLDDPATLFTAAHLAFESRNKQRIELVINSAIMRSDLHEAFVGSLAFISRHQAKALLNEFLLAKDTRIQAIALLGFAAQQVDPGDLLPRAMLSPDPLLRSAALQTAAALGRIDLTHFILRSQSTDLGFCTSLAWAAARLGVRNRDVLQALCTNAEGKSLQAEQACRMALRCLPLCEARRWVQHLWESAGLRSGIQAAAELGDIMLLPAILEVMDRPQTARLAAQAFSTITGVALKDAALDTPKPVNFEPGPNDDPTDPDVTSDLDQGLPWPEANRVRAWWAAHEREFMPGVRYFCGQPISRQNLERVLQTGTQDHRSAAALELAVLYPAEPIFPVHAHAKRQRILLQNR